MVGDQPLSDRDQYITFEINALSIADFSIVSMS